MRERGILFSPPMVRACLRAVDPKSQTRRLVTPQPDALMPVEGKNWAMREIEWPADGKYDIGYQAARGDGKLFQVIPCPHGVPGDRLWVREGWAVHKAFDSRPGGKLSLDQVEGVWYCADYDDHRPAPFGRYRSGRFMPRWASRLLLDVVAVRVERLQQISLDDCYAEGCARPNPVRTGSVVTETDNARGWYLDLWDSLNAKRGAPWSSNPWVWVVEFKPVGPTPTASQ